MYHDVPRAERGAGYFAVPRPRFAAQLDRIIELGLRGVSLEEALAPRAQDVVALTFDDGDATLPGEALPELIARGMTATFFVITARVGTEGYVTWDELRAMARAGMSVQSHTHTHPFLSELSSVDVTRELRESKARLDAELGQSTAALSLPNGDWPRGWSARDFARAGYPVVATSDWGANAAARELGDGARVVRRYTVRRQTTEDDVAALLERLPSPLSPEGIRLGALRRLRAALGPSRYARWRRRALELLGR
jgi:peptidoglycan/xylan/chitin deacetylase (PgdA/CDA1 family)